MATSGADLLLEALEQYGVTHLFGNPGTTELPLMRALVDSDLEYVLGLHEDIAVGMAAGYASTRRYHAQTDPNVLPLGVVNLHIAPGLAHGLGNTYGASITRAPLLITAGNYATDFQHEEPILSGDLERMIEQFTKWAAEVKHEDALPTMLRRAVRTALTPPTGPVFLSLPMNVLLNETTATPERLGAIPRAGRGDPEQIDQAVSTLKHAREPVMVLGDDIARSGPDAVDRAVKLVEAAGARAYGERLTSEVNFPMDHDQWLSNLSGSAEVMEERLAGDVVVFIGCSTNTPRMSYDRELVPRDAICIHVSNDPWEIGKNLPADVALLGSPELVMDELAERLEAELPSGERRARLDRVEEARAKFESESASGDQSDSEYVTKEQLGKSLREATLDRDVFVINEGITSGRAMRSNMAFTDRNYLANKGGGLGYGLPATIGVAIAEDQRSSSRDIIGFIGDGSYLYYPQTLYTATRYDLDVTIVIANNRNYRILKNNLTKIFGGTPDDYDFVGMDFDPPVDMAKNAESHGATGRRVENPSEITAEIEAAIEQLGPAVLDVLIQD